MLNLLLKCFNSYNEERKMKNDEKICDLLYKWENEFGSNAINNNELRIVFKKHLFFDALTPSDNYYEENLIKCQVSFNIQ